MLLMLHCCLSGIVSLPFFFSIFSFSFSQRIYSHVLLRSSTYMNNIFFYCYYFNANVFYFYYVWSVELAKHINSHRSIFVFNACFPYNNNKTNKKNNAHEIFGVILHTFSETDKLTCIKFYFPSHFLCTILLMTIC